MIYSFKVVEFTMTAIPKLITENEYHKLLGACKNDRDRLIVRLLAGTGMRAGEMVSLKVEDVVIFEGIIHLKAHRTKTNTYRDVIIPPSLKADLEAHMHSLKTDDYLFGSRKKPNSHITTARLRQIIHKLADEAGIQRVYGRDKRGREKFVVSVHSLRHFHAVHSLDAGVKLNDLQSQLGHSNLKTTSIYLAADVQHRKMSYENVEF